MTTVMSRHGGIHAWNLTVPQMRQVLYVCVPSTISVLEPLADINAQWFNVTAIEYGLTIMLTKLSILMLFRRVFIPPRWSVFDITLRALECLLVLFYVSTSIVKIAQCSPREKIWNRQLPGRCINVNNLLNTSGMFNFVTDVVILLIPVKSVWKLQMKRKKKVQIVAVFTVGAMYVLPPWTRLCSLIATFPTFSTFLDSLGYSGRFCSSNIEQRPSVQHDRLPSAS